MDDYLSILGRPDHEVPKMSEKYPVLLGPQGSSLGDPVKLRRGGGGFGPTYYDSSYSLQTPLGPPHHFPGQSLGLYQRPKVNRYWSCDGCLKNRDMVIISFFLQEFTTFDGL